MCDAIDGCYSVASVLDFEPKSSLRRVSSGSSRKYLESADGGEAETKKRDLSG